MAGLASGARDAAGRRVGSHFEPALSAGLVDSLNYEDLHAPLLERDAFVYRKARQWLDDPSIDVLVLHIIGTDKVSHEYPVRGPEYRAKYREVDNFVREVAGRLQPADYLFAISDHGHNELGGHTEDAAYLAHGPLFPADVHQDMNAEDMLFFLSLPYGLVLPADYEGQIRMDLTRLAPDAAQQWLAAQANVWRVSIAGLPSDQAQARLNQEVVRRRTEGQRQTAIDTAWRSSPFLLTAALFVIGELFGWRREPVRTRVLQIAVLIVTLALAFWVFPAGLTWIHDETHRPIAFVAFYVVAAGCGYAFARRRKVDSPRMQLLEVIWFVAVTVWLFAYFGPLGYSLTRHGSLIILTIFSIAAVVIGGGWRALFARPALFLAGLLPLVFYDVESFNLKYPLLDWTRDLLPSGQFLAAGIAITLFVVALPRLGGRDRFLALLLVAAWFGLSRFFFQFDLAKLVGGLLACCWFAGCLELFRRPRLPVRWFALIGAVFLFVLLTFFLNGFALSHVDFRFAANKIYPFAREIWRAPQLILWSALKYAFALLPALILIQRAAGNSIWPQLLLLGWARELTIVAGALGLAIFNARGMGDLCAEEIYFWTFLNLVLFAAYLIFSCASPSSIVPDRSAT